MKTALLLVAILAGCSSVPREEIAWQALHAVDVAQTVQIAESDCFREDDPLTRDLIGENPSAGEALLWGAGVAWVHAGVTSWLHGIDAPRWLQAGWQVLTITNTAHAVKNNQEQGIHPWGSGC